MILHIVTLLPAIQISRCLQITCILIVNNETAAMYPFPRFARRFLSQYVQETKNYVCVSSFIAASKALSYIFHIISVDIQDSLSAAFFSHDSVIACMLEEIRIKN